MPGRELDVLAFTRCRDVINLVTAHTSVLQHAVKTLLRQRHGIATTYALTAPGQPMGFAALATKQYRLDRPGADINADGGDAHGYVLQLVRFSTTFPSSTTARQAKVAPPSAPV